MIDESDGVEVRGVATQPDKPKVGIIMSMRLLLRARATERLRLLP
jgi:hypothetical protein